MPVFVDSDLWVELPPGVLERIGERACGGGQLAERIVGVGFGECSRRVAQRTNRTQAVSFVITGGAGAKFR